MAEARFKTPSKFKLSAPAGDEIQNVRNLPAPLRSCQAGVRREQLLAIIADPVTLEQDWIAACQELEQHNQRLEEQYRQYRRRRKLVSLVAALMLIGTGIGAARFLHLGPFALPKEAIVLTPKPDYGTYMGDLQKEIKSNWQPPSGSAPYKIVTYFRIDRAGFMSDIKILSSDGGADADAAALQALSETSGNAPTLPEGANDMEQVTFTFEYNKGS